MKPRVEKPNAWEIAARERKAGRLAILIVQLSSDNVTPLEVFGRLTPEQWVNLAVILGQKKPRVPSAECQAMVLARLREHARLEAGAA